jgi:hypothetical protein
MTPALTQRQIATFRQVFDALFDFLRWTYGVALSGHDRMLIERRILSGWPHPDGSVPELTAYLGGLHTTVFSEPPARRDRYRSHVRQLLGSLFAAVDPTERGEVIALLHRMLEQARPGCTGVAPPVMPTASARHAAGPVPTGVAPTWYAQGAGPVSPYASPAAAAPVGVHPGFAVPPGVPPGPAMDDPDLLDMMRLRAETERQQALMIDQNIWKMRSDLASKVIDSMGR